MNKLGIIFFPAYDWAISPTHPEREERLLYTQDQVMEEGIFDIEGICEYKPLMANEEDIKWAHICIPDVRSRITESHLISAGGAMKAADLVLSKETEKAFAIVRPPGHHAMRMVHGARGFCNINIEAVMIEYLRNKYGNKRIAVIDTDCHHGDGTQDIYWHDRDTLFISLHQDGRTLYPGTGFIEEFGGPNAVGYTINIPLPPYTSDDGFLYVVDNLILPILEEYRPDIIINSAGQDNHYTDPITNMRFSAIGYAELNKRINPHIAVLEGGYSIEGALPYVNLGIILAMAGLDYGNIREPDYDPSKMKQSEEITRYIKDLCKIQLERWKNRDIIREGIIKNKKYIDRIRNIYYDTDGISEYQRERAYVCDECSGVLEIWSTSDAGFSVYAVVIPRNACDKCLERGLYFFEKADENSFDYVYLQDKRNGLFIRR